MSQSASADRDAQIPFPRFTLMTTALEKLTGAHARFLRLGLLALALCALAWLGFDWLKTPAKPPVAHAASIASAAPNAPNAQSSAHFEPTSAQWTALKIEAAQLVRFDSVVFADGVIATNDNATAAVYSPFSGRVTAIAAQLGQSVRKGAPLATLLATEVAQSGSDLAVALATEGTARKQLDLARLTEQRQHDLLLADAGSQKDWLQSQSDLVAAENAQLSAHATVVSVRARSAILGKAGGKSDSTDNATNGQTHITAPIDGVVVQRQLAPGQFVSSLSNGGSAALFTIADLRTVWVIASVSEADAMGLRVGQVMEVSPLAGPPRTLRAQISWIASMVDPATHRVAVRAELPNADLSLRPQMSVTLRLFAGHPVESVAIARSAIIYDGPIAHCYVVTREHSLVARELKIGRTQGSLVEVTAGLAAGDQVVTRGALFIDSASEDAAS